MPFKKNTKGGKKKRRGRGPGKRTGPLILKGENQDIDQLYGRVKSRSGGNPPILEVECEDGSTKSCRIRGKLTKRCWMNPGDTVLINYNKDLPGGEIEKKYTPQEVAKLIKLGQFTSSTFKTASSKSDDGIVIGDQSNASVLNSIDDDDNNVNDEDDDFDNEDYTFNFDNI